MLPKSGHNLPTCNFSARRARAFSYKALMHRISQHIDVVGATTSLTFFGVGLAQINELLTAVALIISIVAGVLTIWHRYRK